MKSQVLHVIPTTQPSNSATRLLLIAFHLSLSETRCMQSRRPPMQLSIVWHVHKPFSFMQCLESKMIL